VRAFVVGVMGAGEHAGSADIEAAEMLGEAIAKRGWVTLCGGRDAGVMKAVASSARAHGGLTIGLLPDTTRDRVAPGVLLALPTGLGNARNAVNVLAANAVVALAGKPGAGTLSEMALALKSDRALMVWTDAVPRWRFLETMGGRKPLITDDVDAVIDSLEAIATRVSHNAPIQPIHLMSNSDR